MNKAEKLIEEYMREHLGLDTASSGLLDTPKRVHKALLEMTAGLREEGPGITSFPNEDGYSGIIMSD